jgi:hypothetical protein
MEPVMEQLTLGPTPREEECAQVGTDEYPVRVRREGKAYIGQLVRMFANPPEGAQFRLKSFPHDFGNYYEVVVSFDPAVKTAAEFARHVEGNLPSEWDEPAKAELAAYAQEPV